MARKNRKRRIRGSGALFYSPTRGVWVARRIVGTGADGKPRILERNGDSAREAAERLAEVGPPAPTITLREWCERWIAECQVRHGTRTRRQTIITHYLTPALGHLAVASITPLQIERACAEWLTARKGSTVRAAVSVLNTAMVAAVRAGIRNDNPVRVAKKPKGERTRVEPYSPATLRKIIAAASRQPRTRIIALVASVGCRIGEAQGLDVGDLIEEKRGKWSVRIERTFHQDGRLGPPKTQNGIRTLPVPDDARKAVLAAAGKRKSGPLFADENGRRLRYQSVNRMWRRLCRTLGLPPQSLHKLRHSCASNLLASGFPLPEVARFLGDSVSSVVFTYLHSSSTADPRAAVNRMLRGKRA